MSKISNLNINGNNHNNGKPLLINGTQAEFVRVNGVVVWRNIYEPEIILDFQASDDKNAEVWVSFTPSPNADSHDLYRDNVLIASDITNGHIHSVAGVDTAIYKVLAINTVSSTFSNEDSGTSRQILWDGVDSIPINNESGLGFKSYINTRDIRAYHKDDVGASTGAIMAIDPVTSKYASGQTSYAKAPDGSSTGVQFETTSTGIRVKPVHSGKTATWSEVLAFDGKNGGFENKTVNGWIYVPAGVFPAYYHRAHLEGNGFKLRCWYTGLYGGTIHPWATLDIS